MKKYTIKTDWITYENAVLKKSKYQTNGNLAVLAVNKGGCIAVITVNLIEYGQLNDDEAFIDTNNCHFAENFLKENKIAEPVGKSFTSGFCTYPLYRFSKEALDSMDG